MRTTLRLFVVLTLVALFAHTVRGSFSSVLTGGWGTVDSLSVPRSGAAAILLTDGRIMVIGGEVNGEPSNSVEFFYPDGTFAAAPSMSIARSGHAAVVLASGEVLVTGGITSGGGITNSAEMFDPVHDTWTQTNPLLEARRGHSALLMPDASVIIIAGDNGTTGVSAIERFSPDRAAFTQTGALTQSRARAAAALLADNRILVAGGTTIDEAGTAVPTASVEVFDPSTGASTFVSSMALPRGGATATALLDGRIAVIGGNDGSRDLASAEIYDASTNAWTSVTGTTPRSNHIALLLPNNNAVFLTGGTSGAQTDLFIPFANDNSGAFVPTSSSLASHAHGVAIGTVIEGLALAAGGDAGSAAEVYRFATVKTDYPDYGAGEYVGVSGTGWQPGETVTLVIHELGTGDPDVVLNAVADQSGNIANSQFAPSAGDYGVRFLLTAMGSNSLAQTSFTDANINTDLALTITPSAVPFGSSGPVVFQATLTRSVNSGGGALAGQTITFQRGSTTLGTAITGANGVATLNFNPSVLPVGAASIKASFDGATIGGDSYKPSNNTQTLTVVADATAPVSTISLMPSVPNGSNNWYRTDVSIVVSVADNVGGTGVAETRCVLDPPSAPSNFDAIPSGCAFAGAGALVSTEGTHVLYLASRDNASNKETVKTASFKIDKTAPSLAIPSNITAEAAGPFGAVVSYSGVFATDNLTATVMPVCTPASGGTFALGTNTVSCSATDEAGNVSSAAFNITVQDTTAPIVSIARMTPANGGGWNNQDVSLQVSCSDAVGIASVLATGAAAASTTPATPSTSEALAVTVTSEGVNQSVIATCTDTAGNQSTDSISAVNIDKTKPVISGSRTPAANGNGWNNTDVTVSFVCAEVGAVQAGIATDTVVGGTLTAEGHNQSLSNSGACLDQAGNAADPATVSGISIDKTKPVITWNFANDSCSLVGNSGWCRGTQTATFSAADVLSGLADTSYVNFTRSTQVNGANVLIASGEVCDLAENCAASLDAGPYKIDSEGPVNVIGTPSYSANSAGWYKAPVTINFSGQDAASGIASCTSPTYSGPDSANATVAGSCTDIAGNSTSGQYVLKYDATAPTLQCTPASYVLNNPMAAVSASVSDNLSGASVSPVSTNVSASQIGLFSASLTGADNAGNSATVSCAYSVTYNTLVTLQQPWSPAVAFKAGSTIPLKWQYTDYYNQVVDSTYADPRAAVYGYCTDTTNNEPILAVEDAGVSGYRYDPVSKTWHFNWKTSKNMAGGCFSIGIKSNQSGQLDGWFDTKVR